MSKRKIASQNPIAKNLPPMGSSATTASSPVRKRQAENLTTCLGRIWKFAMARSNAGKLRSLPMLDAANTKPMPIREKARKYGKRAANIASTPLVNQLPIPKVNHPVGPGSDGRVVGHYHEGDTLLVV